jgi:hypothetical protein
VRVIVVDDHRVARAIIAGADALMSHSAARGRMAHEAMLSRLGAARR